MFFWPEMRDLLGKQPGGAIIWFYTKCSTGFFPPTFLPPIDQQLMFLI